MAMFNWVKRLYSLFVKQDKKDDDPNGYKRWRRMIAEAKEIERRKTVRKIAESLRWSPEETQEAERYLLDDPKLLSREGYEEALKAIAEKRGMTVEEFKRMLDEAKINEDIEKLVEEDMAKMEAERRKREDQ